MFMLHACQGNIKGMDVNFVQGPAVFQTVKDIFKIVTLCLTLEVLILLDS